MLNEFYDFIAKKINSFFQTAAADGTLLKGDNARKVVENARGQVASLLGVENSEVFFTSGSTESNNIAIRGLMDYAEESGKKHVITTNKLELATPKREDLSVYREILRREFEEDTCFYCGKKLQKVIHVDHFIPWSFVKDDKIWNFVLSCPTCNEKKNNRVPGKDYLIRIEDRNKKIQLLNNTVIQTDFAGYSDDLIGRMWSYAKLSGIKEYRG